MLPRRQSKAAQTFPLLSFACPKPTGLATLAVLLTRPHGLSRGHAGTPRFFPDSSVQMPARNAYDQCGMPKGQRTRAAVRPHRDSPCPMQGCAAEIEGTLAQLVVIYWIITRGAVQYNCYPCGVNTFLLGLKKIKNGCYIYSNY